ncbi:Piwi-domain-containing protein [Schizopora paradoxa]|uniref:Piwi-domain-containing protein n=1 Tax=Schizopora paradoxa TaxID=27342 RepID=A0A0H2RHS1_9AGAM|nr:Piwi-domain-containing protein [Schizopora paradoxa]
MAYTQNQNPNFRRSAGAPTRRGDAPYEASVNLFRIRPPVSSIFHFDVVFSPGDDLSPRRKADIILKLQTHVVPGYFAPQAFFDGKANLFAFHDVLQGEALLKFEVNMSRKAVVSGQHHRGLFLVTIKRVQEVTVQDFMTILEGRGEGLPIATTPLQALNVLLRNSLQYKNDFIHRGNMNGLDIVSAFFRSVRPTVDGLYVNVDIITVVNYQSGSLPDLVLAFLGKPDLRELGDYRNGSVLSKNWPKLKKFLEHLKIKQNGDGKVYIVEDLVRDAGKFTFPLKDGTLITVEDHFRINKNVVLRYPSWFGIKTKREEVIPLECCTVEQGQQYRRPLTPAETTKVIKAATKKPNARFRDIESGVEKLAVALIQSPCLTEQDRARLAVVREPLLVTGRVLNTPSVMYRGQKTITPKNGFWNLKGDPVVFQKPSFIRSWGVLLFDASISQKLPKLRDNMMKLKKCMDLLVLGFDEAKPEFHSGNPSPDQAGKALDALKRSLKGPPAMILVILPDNAAETKRAVKYWGDIKEGIVTQCVKSSKIMGANDQYLNNVCMKINGKLGGSNHFPVFPDISCLDISKTMAIGIDVSHPGPGVQKPSVASVVGSHDKWLSQYTSCISIQTPRKEMVENLFDMLWELFPRYWMFRGKEYKEPALPDHIVIFRDGVSEGELQTVVNEEFSQIKDVIEKAWAHIKMKSRPKVTFIVVGKRHHIRFSPSHMAGDPSGNCPSGFVMNDKISMPGTFDFYLQSQGGLLGTSRPGHYIVVRDENGFRADQLQAFCFALCHNYVRSTSAVSIPAPVYYADLACGRADYHYDPSFDLDASSAGVNDEFNLEEWKAHFKKVHKNLIGALYFI